MNDVDIKPILEGILFTSESPVRMETLSEILPEWSPEAVSDGIERIKKEWEDGLKGLELVEVAGGYQFRTKPQWAEYIHRLKKKKPVKLSQSALETLAIIAYRQPVIRPEIEEIRGVDSGWVVRTLLEKGLIRMMPLDHRAERYPRWRRLNGRHIRLGGDVGNLDPADSRTVEFVGDNIGRLHIMDQSPHLGR